MSDSSNLQSEVDKYRNMLATDPTSKAFAPLADLYRKMGNHQEALKVCRHGLHHHPDYSGANILLSRILMELKQFDDAEKELIQIIRKTPNHLPAHQLLARLYLQTARQNKAVAIAERIVRLDANDPTAKAILAKQPATNPTPTESKPEALPTVTMARLYEEQGHLQKALEIYTTLQKTQPDLATEVTRVKRLIANKHKVDKLNQLLKKVTATRTPS